MFFEWWRLLCCGAGVEYKNVFEAGVFFLSSDCSSSVMHILQWLNHVLTVTSCERESALKCCLIFHMQYFYHLVFVAFLKNEENFLYDLEKKNENFLCVFFWQFFSIFDKVIYFLRKCHLELFDVLKWGIIIEFIECDFLNIILQLKNYRLQLVDESNWLIVII